MPHQFIVYGDSCSGIPGAPHEATTAAVNRVVAALPDPDFVAFLGDEVMGLTSDEAALRAQWRYWLDHEMAWLDRARIPLYTVPANHTTYDAMSERVYAEALDHLPQNGPPGQERLSYWVRRGDLLLVFVNTMSTALGEGRVETDWLEATLRQHADAAHTLVLGHHPVFAANGFSGAYQRELEPENGRRFWAILRRHGVLAYLCSHMLAFDVQAHDGILQIMTAGAGTAHRLPPEWEYLHAVQMALDAGRLRYRVLDTDGVTRESLAWPIPEPAAGEWVGEPSPLIAGEASLPAPGEPSPPVPGEPSSSAPGEPLPSALGEPSPPVPGEPSPPAPLPMRGRGEPISGGVAEIWQDHADAGEPFLNRCLDPAHRERSWGEDPASSLLWLDVTGETAAEPAGSQTVLAGWNDDPWLPPLWIGLIGPEQRLSVLLAPQVAQSAPVDRTGVPGGAPLAGQLLRHPGMGPGGVLWRAHPGAPWSSLTAASPWGPERLPPVHRITIGHGKGGPSERPWLGPALRVRLAATPLPETGLL